MTQEFASYTPTGGPFEVKLLYIDNRDRGKHGGLEGHMKSVAKDIQAIYNEAASTSGNVVATHEISYDYGDIFARSLFFVVEHSDTTNPAESSPQPDGQPAISSAAEAQQ